MVEVGRAMACDGEKGMMGSMQMDKQKELLQQQPQQHQPQLPGTTPLKSSEDGLRARGLLTEAVCAALLDRLAPQHEHLLKPKEAPPRQCCQRCRTAVELSIAVGARVYFRPGCGRLQSAFEEQERGQKRRVSAGYHHRDPTCMWYRDSLPGPDPVGTLAIDVKIATIFLVVVRARRFIVSAVADHACLSTSVCVIVAKMTNFRVQAALALMKGYLQCLKEWLSSWQLRQSPRFSRRASTRGERRPLQQGGSSVLNEAITAKPSA